MIALPSLSFGQPYQMVNYMKLLASMRNFRHGFIRMLASRSKAVSLLALLMPFAAFSDSVTYGESEGTLAEDIWIYSSLEQRRTAGLGRKINNWLTVSGLLEVEVGERRDKVRNGLPELRENIFISTLQLGLEAALSESLSAELLFESEWDDGNRSRLDEAFLALEGEKWVIEAGRLYLPFGVFYNNFITGPLLEFGETRGTGLVAYHSLSEAVVLRMFAFDGETENWKKNDALNWGVGFDLSSEDRAVRAGATYLADLTDAADVSGFDFANSGRNRVGGLSGYVLVGLEPFEMSAEIIRSLREFAAFEEDANQPTAWYLELAYAPRPSLLFAFRVEGSDELPQEPQNQVGVSATWKLNQYAWLSVEYLFGRYKDGFVRDDSGNPFTTRRRFAIQVSAEF
ncbi:MAG: LbtU family siderophore porin [Gammaproteobacteria bacterium]|nr:LbtU family siderophore porin [Gammaproteobacteria bacterium]